MGDPDQPRLTRDDILHVAQLASLALTEDEVERLGGELTAILAYMASLDALDVEGVEPTYHPVAEELVGRALRPDAVVPSLDRERALASAPGSEAGGFAVPKVLDGDG